MGFFDLPPGRQPAVEGRPVALAKQQGRRSRDRGRIVTTTWGEPEPGGGLPFFYPIVSEALATPPCTLT